MPVNSCSSCPAGNLATQYAEELAEKRLDRLRGIEPDPNDPGQPGGSQQYGGARIGISV